mgnify:CR=1 FL=1
MDCRLLSYHEKAILVYDSIRRIIYFNPNFKSRAIVNLSGRELLKICIAIFVVFSLIPTLLNETVFGLGAATAQSGFCFSTFAEASGEITTKFA